MTTDEVKDLIIAFTEREHMIYDQKKEITRLTAELADKINIINNQDLRLNQLQTELAANRKWIQRGEYCVCAYPHNKDSEITRLAAELSRYKQGVELEGVVRQDILTGHRFVQTGITRDTDFAYGQRVRVLVMKEGGDE